MLLVSSRPTHLSHLTHPPHRAHPLHLAHPLHPLHPLHLSHLISPAAICCTKTPCTFPGTRLRRRDRSRRSSSPGAQRSTYRATQRSACRHSLRALRAECLSSRDRGGSSARRAATCST